MDAWETRYADQRQAAIYRLEQLCIEKHHLKLPNNASNPNSKAKKKNVDVSQLKGPATDDANKKVPATSQDVTETHFKAASDEEKSVNVRTTTQDISERTPIKASKLAVTAKPHGVKATFAPVGNGRMVSSRKSQDSPEPMSTDMSEAERSSRSPSPIKDDEIFPNIMESSSTKTVDNANHITTTSFAQNSDRSTTTNAATNNTTSTGHNINDLNENQKNDNDVPNQAT